jgi:hypothetical protein
MRTTEVTLVSADSADIHICGIAEISQQQHFEGNSYVIFPKPQQA